MSRYSKFGICAREDVVLIPHAGGLLAGKILHNLQVDGVPISIVDLWQPKEVNKPKGYAIWDASFNPQLEFTEDIIDCCIYRTAGTECITLLSARFRS